MANDGFVKLYRKMRKWGWYDEPNTKAVFLHLLFLAQYEETFYRGIHLEIGQAVATLPEIAIENGLSVKCVRTSIGHLKDTGEVAVKKYPRFTVYTIKNYEIYNGAGSQGAVKGQDAGSQGAVKGHSHMLRSQEIKEVKKYKNNTRGAAKPHTSQFMKPSLEEIEAYCEERGNGIDARYFLDYYEANGWKVGRNQMKDWKAAVRNWEHRQRDDKKPQDSIDDQFERVFGDSLHGGNQ